MSPEQAAGGRVDGRTDLYALGCVLYEMVTGGLPFTGASAAAIVDAKMKGSPERARDRVPSKRLPEAVDELLMRALSRHPGLRFQSASEMREAVLLALGAPARTRKRRRAMGFAALAGVMAFASVLLVGKARDLGVRLPFSEAARPAVGQAAQVDSPARVASPAAAAPNAPAAAPAPVQLAEVPIPARPEAIESAPASPARSRAPQKKPAEPRAAAPAKLAQNEPAKPPSPPAAVAPVAPSVAANDASAAPAAPAAPAAADARPASAAAPAAPSPTAQQDTPAAPARVAPAAEPKDKDETAAHLRRKKKTRLANAKASGSSPTTGNKPASKTK
jgi:serine/threonine-protein kinase